jgi:uracil-DNA glycosylase
MDLLVVGECLSNKDEGQPFHDGNGKMFKSMLRQVGIDPRQTMFLNVFLETPPSRGNVLGFFGPKATSKTGVRMLKAKTYIQEQHWCHVERIRELVAHHKPNLVLAVGEVAMWALTSETSIDQARGRVCTGMKLIPEQKVLPCYSPRTVQIEYPKRPILLADLTKARRELEFPEIRRPRHLIHIEPTIEDLEEFFTKYIADAEELSCDIETKPGGNITCVGFAPDSEVAIVVPFYCKERPNGNYWPTVKEEVLAWQWVQRVLHYGRATYGQNFQYDMSYLWRYNGIDCPHFSDDTMLLHHTLQPEMLKGLGFLASIYTDEPAWKFMHKKPGKDKSGKKDDNQ